MGTRKARCGLRPDELLAYTERALTAGRQAALAEYLQTCSPCQDRLAAWDETGRILRQGIAPIDDPHARAAILDRLAQAARPPTPPSRVPRILILIAAAVMLLLLVWLFL